MLILNAFLALLTVSAGKNGKRRHTQEPTLVNMSEVDVQCPRASADMVFVVDSSWSIADSAEHGDKASENWPMLMKVLSDAIHNPQDFSNQILPGDAVGLIQAATEVDALVRPIDRVPASKINTGLKYTGGWTNIKEAVEEALYMMLEIPKSRWNAFRKIVIFTDGILECDAEYSSECDPCDDKFRDGILSVMEEAEVSIGIHALGANGVDQVNKTLGCLVQSGEFSAVFPLATYEEHIKDVEEYDPCPCGGYKSKKLCKKSKIQSCSWNKTDKLCEMKEKSVGKKPKNKKPKCKDLDSRETCKLVKSQDMCDILDNCLKTCNRCE